MNVQVSKSAFISPSTEIIGGPITIEDQVFIGPQAIIRADEGSPFFIGKGTNIQDQVILHGLLNQKFEINGEFYSIYIGSHCSIAHRALIHGPTIIGKKCFIGFGAIINKSQIGRNCHIEQGVSINNSVINEYCLIEDRAIIKNVFIPPYRRVNCGLTVNSQEIADTLPIINKNLMPSFNKEVVDFNKYLIVSLLEK